MREQDGKAGGAKRSGRAGTPEQAGKGRTPATAKGRGAEGPAIELSSKDYARELTKLHVEPVELRERVEHAGLEVRIVFEGRDGAGKGRTIEAITERVRPRVFRVIALPAPTEREKSQIYG